jgi:hypothetical protein
MACPAIVPAPEPMSGAWLTALRWYLPLSLAAHLAWEVAQLPLYTIWREGSAGEIAFALLHCTLGDGLIAAVTLVLTLVLVGHADWPQRRFAEVAAAATVTGVGYTVWSEWLNVTVRGTWAYAVAMPTVPPLGTGLTPLLQWLILPAFCLFAARRRTLGPSSPSVAIPSGPATRPAPTGEELRHVR